MKVNVDEWDFETSSQEIRGFLQKAISLHQNISGYCGNSELHIQANDNKISGKIASWKSKTDSLESLKKALQQEIETASKKKDAAQRNTASAMREINSCTDESKKESLQQKVDTYAKEIDVANKKIEENTKKLQQVEEDIRIAKEYLLQLNEIREINRSAKTDIEVVRNHITLAINNARAESDRCLIAINALKECIKEFNPFDYRESFHRGTPPSLSIPEFYRPPLLIQRLATKIVKTNTSTPTITLPPKMRLVSSDNAIVEIIGPYTNKGDLGKDLMDVKKLFPNKCSVCIKKPVTNAVPCIANIKEFAEFTALCGYAGKVTAMGTRYTDADGRIYFNRSGG